jgi:hypothetical protein
MYIPLVGVAALVAGFRVIERWRLYAWFLASLFFITGAFLAYTINQLEDGFCLLMLMAGLGAVFVRQTAARVVPGRLGQRLAWALAIVIAAIAARDTAVFAAKVDATRSVPTRTTARPWLIVLRRRRRRRSASAMDPHQLRAGEFAGCEVPAGERPRPADQRYLRCTTDWQGVRESRPVAASWPEHALSAHRGIRSVESDDQAPSDVQRPMDRPR